MEKKEQLGQCGREGKVSLMESAITFYQYNGLRHLCATTSTHTGGGMYLFSSFSWFSLSNRTMVQLGGALELFKRPSAQKMRPWWMKTRGVAVGNESTGHWFLQRLWWAAEGEGGSDEIRETRDVNYESEEDSALQARFGARIAWKTKY